MAYYQNTLSFQAIAFYFTHPPTPALKGRGSSLMWSFAPYDGAKLHKNFCSPSKSSCFTALFSGKSSLTPGMK